ncbi:MAG: Murein hydrolase activator EnvC precursor [Firmicutes bacterium ADurb.Bin193]|nr:MAG: Murein hydrolase activator EnvC precursor [Firmicutes bacterium ADurb.Bin193]
MVGILKLSAKTIKITAIIVVFFFLAVFIIPVIFNFIADAAPAVNRQDTMRKIQSEIDREKALQRNLLEEKKKSDQKVAEIEARVEAIQKDVDVHTARLAVLEAELKDIKKNADLQYETLKKRIRIMYEQGTDSYLDALLSSVSLTDFLNRFEIIQQIAKYDNDRLNSLRNSMQKIEETTQLVKVERAEQQKKMSDLQAEKKTLSVEQAKRNAIFDESKATVAELEKRYKQEEELDRQEKAAAAAKMSKNTKYSGGTMAWPTPSCYTITSPFGSRYHPVLKKNKMHYGVDIGAQYGASVVAANDGKVIRSLYSASYGNYIMIDHGGGIATLYAHGSALLVSEGDSVKKGQQIMRVGSTGISTGPHLHYEIIVGGTNVDPMSYYR